MQDLDPRTRELVPSVAAPALRITGSGPHGSDSTSSSGSDGRPPQASPVLVDPAPYAFPEWAEDPQLGRWHFAEETELSNDLGQRAFRMRSATFETVNVQQQWQELDALAAHYPGFAAESTTVRQETLAFVSDLSGVIRSLARQTNAGLTQAWTEGHTLHQQVRHLDDQLGRLSRSGDELRAEQLSQLSVLTALQANTAAAVAVAAAAAAPDLATIKAAMEVEIKRAVEAQLGPPHPAHQRAGAARSRAPSRSPGLRRPAQGHHGVSGHRDRFYRRFYNDPSGSIHTPPQDQAGHHGGRAAASPAHHGEQAARQIRVQAQYT